MIINRKFRPRSRCFDSEYDARIVMKIFIAVPTSVTRTVLRIAGTTCEAVKTVLYVKMVVCTGHRLTQPEATACSLERLNAMILINGSTHSKTIHVMNK